MRIALRIMHYTLIETHLSSPSYHVGTRITFSTTDAECFLLFSLFLPAEISLNISRACSIIRVFVLYLTKASAIVLSIAAQTKSTHSRFVSKSKHVLNMLVLLGAAIVVCVCVYNIFAMHNKNAFISISISAT